MLKKTALFLQDGFPKISDDPSNRAFLKYWCNPGIEAIANILGTKLPGQQGDEEEKKNIWEVRRVEIFLKHF